MNLQRLMTRYRLLNGEPEQQTPAAPMEPAAESPATPTQIVTVETPTPPAAEASDNASQVALEHAATAEVQSAVALEKTEEISEEIEEVKTWQQQMEAQMVVLTEQTATTQANLNSLTLAVKEMVLTLTAHPPEAPETPTDQQTPSAPSPQSEGAEDPLETAEAQTPPDKPAKAKAEAKAEARAKPSWI